MGIFCNQIFFSISGSSEFDWPHNDLCSSTTSDCKSFPSRRKSTSSLPCNPTKISNHNLVLQQLRVALKKLPEAKLKPLEAVKRRHSDCGSHIEASKKPKWGHHQRRPLSASIGKGQGKITEYLPEMKHFIAMRKEKLDRVLNLGEFDTFLSPLPHLEAMKVVYEPFGQHLGYFDPLSLCY